VEQATADWKKYFLLGLAGTGVMGTLQFFIHLSHSPHDDLTRYSFRRIRNKPYPWGTGQESLFGCRYMCSCGV